MLTVAERRQLDQLIGRAENLTAAMVLANVGFGQDSREAKQAASRVGNARYKLRVWLDAHTAVEAAS